MQICNGSKRREKLFIKEDVVILCLAKITLTDKMEKDQPTAYNKLIRYQLEAQRVLQEYFMGTEEKAKNFYANLELIDVIKNLEIVINTQNVQINNIETMVEKQQKKLENVLDNITLTTTQQRESPPEERK